MLNFSPISHRSKCVLFSVCIRYYMQTLNQTGRRTRKRKDKVKCLGGKKQSYIVVDRKRQGWVLKSENDLSCVDSYCTCGKNKAETEWNEERSETNFVVFASATAWFLWNHFLFFQSRYSVCVGFVVFCLFVCFGFGLFCFFFKVLPISWNCVFRKKIFKYFGLLIFTNSFFHH